MFVLKEAIFWPDVEKCWFTHVVSSVGNLFHCLMATHEKAKLPKTVLHREIVHSPRTVDLVARDVISELSEINFF